MAQRTPLIAGNWKMYLDLESAKALAREVVAAAAGLVGREVMIAPSFPLLPAVKEIVAGSTVLLAGQNVCWKEEGAYTGEVSPVVLRQAGCSMVIVGHSERRHIFGEGNEMINQRLRGALQSALTPILCIGETMDEREDGKTYQVLEEQLQGGLEGVESSQAARLVLAYEPVWAIGTGKTATPGQAQEVHAFIRQLFTTLYDKNLAEQVRILYGGSVKPENIDDLMSQPDIDGALVGGASLQAGSFARIVRFHS